MAKKTKKLVKKKQQAKQKTASTLDFNKLDISPHPTSDRIAEFESQLDNQLDGGEQKRGRGRPSNAEIEAQQQSIETELTMTAIKAGVKMPFALWANFNDVELLKLTDPEANELAKSYYDLLRYFSAKIPEIVILCINATFTTTAIVGAKLIIVKKEREKRQGKTPSSENPASRTHETDGGSTSTPPSRPDKIQTGKNGFPTFEEITKKHNQQK